MIGLIQLVSTAKIEVNQVMIASISRGIVALIGMEKTDNIVKAHKLIEKILNIRIFPDDQGKMNLSLKDINGELLLVPQFTLVAETAKGNRPGFSVGMPPKEGELLFESLVTDAKKVYAKIQSGQFGADMQVTLCNDGPATFILNA